MKLLILTGMSGAGKSTAIKIVDMWKTEDKLNRNGFFWINVIAQKP